MRTRRLALRFFAAATLLVTATLIASAGAAGQSGGIVTHADSPASHEVEIVGVDYAFTVPANIPAGPTVFRFRNDGKVAHELNITLLREGATLRQFMDTPGSTYREATVGVLFAAPRRSASARLVTDLLPGRTCALICINKDTPKAKPHFAMGMFSAFTVSSHPATPAAAPEMRVDTIVASEYSYRYPRTLVAGHHRFAFVNTGTVRHEFVMLLLKRDVTLQHLLDGQKSGGSVDPMIENAIGVLHSPPGTSPLGLLDVDMLPGRVYTIICTLSNDAKSPPHFMLGMHGSIRVTPLAIRSPPLRDTMPARDIAIVGAAVIDVAAGSAIHDRTVVVHGTRVLAMGPRATTAVPRGALVVNGTGKFLIPGLWDMHGHIYPHEKGAPTDERAWQLPLYIATGVTGVRDMWTNLEDFAQMSTWNAASAEGQLVAPRIVSTGPMLDGPTGIFRDIAIVVTSTADAKRVVDSIASGGARAVKIHNAIPREAFFALAARSRERGLPLIGHVPTAVTVREAIAAGQSDIEHYTESDGCASAAAEAEAMRLRTDTSRRSPPGRVQQIIMDGYDGPRCADLMKLLVARGVWVTPTLVAAQYLLDPADPTINNRDELGYVPAAERAQWETTRETVLRRMPRATLESRRRVFAAQQSLVGTLQRAGVRLMVGTDVSNDWLVPGFSVHDELALFVRSGLTPAAALRAATLTPAKYLHATDSLGTIATGHIADLVLLDANPLDDIHATKRIRAVIARGRYLDRTALNSLLSAARSRADQLSPPHDPQDSTQFAFTHVTVIDVENGRSIADRTVVVRGSRILAVADGSAVPSAGTRIVDGRGKFLIPGLWDMHAHAVRDTPNTLPLFVANGITGVRDMGDDLDSTMAAAARDRSGPGASPRFVLAGAIIDGAPTVYPDVSVTARTPAEGRHWVDSLASRGVDFIKAYEMLRPEVAAAIVDEARMHHLDVVGHVPLTMNAGAVSDLGYRSIEHLRNVDVACSSIADSLIGAATDQLRAGERDGRPGGAVRSAIFDARAARLLATFNPVRCDAVLRRFRRNDTWQVPTFVVGEFFFTRSDTTQRLRARLRFLPPSTRADWMKASHGLDIAQAELAAQLGGTPALGDVLIRTRARYHAIFRRMLALGVPVLAGTDFGNPWVMPGFSLHDELALFVQDGMSPLDALRSATLSPARFLRATDSLGTIAPGKLADLVLLDADPLLNIDNTGRIRAVIADGRLFDRASLDAMLATAERAGLGPVPFAVDSLPRIDANDNGTPAGRESHGVLQLHLAARLGRWYPQADSGPTEPIEAFGEEGHRPLVPGPLVRVRSGTHIEITLHNTLTRQALVVYGLHARPGSPNDTVQVAAGETRTIRFAAGDPGTYFYWASTTGQDIDHRNGIDSQLSGAIVIDSAASATPAIIPRKPRDRVFVIGVWHADRDTTGPKPWVERDQMVINGKSWPFTERFDYTVGDTVRWRWVNPTADAHAMHLHGFFYTIESGGTWSRDTIYATADRRAVVTQTMLPGSTMAIRWVPREPGDWLFHCHFAFHVSQYLSLNKVPNADDPEAMGHGVHEMAGMVLGVRVRQGHTAAVPAMQRTTARATPYVAPREIRLLIQSTSRRFVVQTGPTSFDTTAAYGYVVDQRTAPVPRDSVPVLSPTLVLRRGEPVRVTLVNHLRAPTAVHWHGIELKDSYFDGVPGWSGMPGHIAPAIAPGDSFVAEFTPPRAGTYMYHSHSNESVQIGLGLYGAIVVVDSGRTYDPTTDRMFVIGKNGPDTHHGRVNGLVDPAPETLTVGTTYRFRIVEINPDWRVFASLTTDSMADSTVLHWRPVAKDGADLPAHQATMRLARVLMGAGETADFEFTPTAAGMLRLEFTTMLPGWTLAVPLHVRATGPDHVATSLHRSPQQRL